MALSRTCQRGQLYYFLILKTEFPRDHLADWGKAVDIRRDIVHRNGRTVQDEAWIAVVSNLESLLELVDATVQHIGRQPKDGLLENDGRDAPT